MVGIEAINEYNIRVMGEGECGRIWQHSYREPFGKTRIQTLPLVKWQGSRRSIVSAKYRRELWAKRLGSWNQKTAAGSNAVAVADLSKSV